MQAITSVYKIFSDFKNPLSVAVFSVNKRLYFEGIKYDFYRKCLLPDPVDDYTDITIVGRSDPYEDNEYENKRACGSYYGSYICECGKTRVSRMNYCYRPTCKICQHKAITRQVQRITEYITKIEDLEGSPLKLAHYTFNTIAETKAGKILFPIKDIISYRYYKKKLIRILKKYGATGTLIFHPYRKNWKLINIGVPAVKKSGHFHFIGRFNNLIDGGAFFRKHKFTYKNITYNQYKAGKLAEPYLNGINHIANVLRYNLSHGAVLSKNMQTYSYIGKFSPYYYKKINKLTIETEVLCEKDCKKPLRLLDTYRYEKIDGKIESIRNFRIEKKLKYDSEVMQDRHYTKESFIDLYIYEKPLKFINNENLIQVRKYYDLIYRTFS